MRHALTIGPLSRALTVAIAAIVSAAAPAGAAIFPYTVGTGEGNGADNYVRGGTFAGDNFQTPTALLVNNAGADLSQASKVYLRFDLTQVPGWNGVAQNASLRIPFVDTQTGTTPPLMDWTFRLYALNDGPAENFSEAGLNWNNAPGNDPASAAGVGAGTTLITPFDVQARGSETVFFGAPLDQLLNQDTNDLVTFIIVRETAAAAGADYVHAVAAPQEAFTGPLLVVPEPAGAALAAVALGAAALRRRAQ
jgi:hypothetical protein